MMDYAAFLAAGIIIGHLMCYLAVKPVRSQNKASDEPQEIMVKRTRLSMRSPLKTVRTEYDKYKMGDTGLYAPVRPKATNNDQIEVGR